ncbi:MAG: hypothetical protein HY454_03745 [Parcubacteria group bacterium]|nr:hypothetical protein [Parcubacteria group bacterium]
MRQGIDSYDSPKSKLKRAREAVEVLRMGFWVNRLGKKIYLHPGEYSGIAGYISDINEALEAGFLYKQIGTMREEVIGFRNGEAHKTSARLLLEISRKLERSPLDYDIIRLAEDAGFALEEVGTSAAELESLSREYSRRVWESSVDRFRAWATGTSDWHEDPDEFEEELARLLSPEHYGFSYEDLRTSEEECAELLRLARRREVVRHIDYLKRSAEKGEIDSCSFARGEIKESLDKAGLALSDFNITESDLDEIERSAYITRATNLLNELKTPGEGWFYLTYPTNPNIRLYRPGLRECIPGDPLVFVKKIEENLATADATLADIGTSETEIKTLVCAGHLSSAKFLLEELERVSQIPRRTQFERIASMVGPKTVIMDDPDNPIDRETLEEPYPIERDIQAIEYHLKGAGVELEEIGSSRQKLQELRTVIEAR